MKMNAESPNSFKVIFETEETACTFRDGNVLFLTYGIVMLGITNSKSEYLLHLIENLVSIVFNNHRCVNYLNPEIVNSVQFSVFT